MGLGSWVQPVSRAQLRRSRQPPVSQQVIVAPAHSCAAQTWQGSVRSGQSPLPDGVPELLPDGVPELLPDGVPDVVPVPVPVPAPVPVPVPVLEPLELPPEPPSSEPQPTTTALASPKVASATTHQVPCRRPVIAQPPFLLQQQS